MSKDDIRIEKLELGQWGTNTYIVVDLKTGDSLLIDAPDESNRIINSLKGTNPRYILLTHNHYDHTGALAELQSRLGIPVAAHPLDGGNLPLTPQKWLKDGDTLLLGSLKLEVLHTPGHTPGSLCFRAGHYLIAGDTLFPGGPGRTGSPADFSRIIKSITEKIFVLPDNTLVYPGHGDSLVLKKAKEEFAVFSTHPHNADLSGDVLWLSS